MTKHIKLNPEANSKLRTVDSRLMSYNVEMTEVTGGTFWKAYTPAQIAGTEAFQFSGDLSDFKLGSVWVRVSGNGDMCSSVGYLNGKALILDDNDAIPALCGEKVQAGLVELALEAAHLSLYKNHQIKY